MIVLGDVHGRWHDLAGLLVRAQVRDRDILQLGDFGIGFGSPELETRALRLLDDILVERGCRLWAIRGNHDRPDRWVPEAPQPWQAIRLVPDYTVLRLEGLAVLCIGGAISVDRLTRSPGKYWPDEGFTLDSARLAQIDLTNLSMVATHTAPDGAFPREFGPIVAHFAQHDPTLLQELSAERRAMATLADLIAERVTPQYWCYCHFHDRHVEQIGSTCYVLLGIFEYAEIPPVK
jgi:Calcineurin-like phosphoesterase